MGIFNIFEFKNEKQLAVELVAQLVKELPPKFMDGKGASKLSVNKITRSLERAYSEVINHQENGVRMGLVRRSILANTFKWGLRESGYSADFCDVATEGLIMEFAKLKKP